MDYPKSGAVDYPVVPNQVPTIEECLRAIAQGKPLPAGAAPAQNPVYNPNILNDYHVHDELWHIEQSRRRVETLRADLDIKSIAERQQRSSNADKAAEQSDSAKSEQPPQ